MEELARKIYLRKNPGVALDPVTIALLISALITIGKQIYECYKNRHQNNVLQGLESNGLLGRLRRWRMRRALAEQGLDSYEEAILAEAKSLTSEEFTAVLTQSQGVDHGPVS